MANFTENEWANQRVKFGIDLSSQPIPVNPHCLLCPHKARTPSPRSFFAANHPIYPDQGAFSKIYSALRKNEDPWVNKNSNKAQVTHAVGVTCESLDGQTQGEHGHEIMGNEVITSNDVPNTAKWEFHGAPLPLPLPPAGEVFDIFADPFDMVDKFQTPDRKTTKGLKSPLPKSEHVKPGSPEINVGSNDSVKTKISFDEYSSETSCESAMQSAFQRLGQSGYRHSKDESAWDVDSITPTKINWKGAISDCNSQSSQSGCDISFQGERVQDKPGISASSSSVRPRSHPYLKF